MQEPFLTTIIMRKPRTSATQAVMTRMRMITVVGLLIMTDFPRELRAQMVERGHQVYPDRKTLHGAPTNPFLA
jgi:hypothetical protein